VSGFELVAGIIGIFFITGIVMGVLIVAVLPAIWRRRAERDRMLRNRRRYLSNRDWEELPPRHDRDGEERPPPWPGNDGR